MTAVVTARISTRPPPLPKRALSIAEPPMAPPTMLATTESASVAMGQNLPRDEHGRSWLAGWRTTAVDLRQVR